MKNSSLCLRTKNFLLLLIILSLEISCSKSPGNTTTKLKLFSGNVFSGTLATAANNGLILFGNSTDGKSFTKKIDNDSADLVFPNGTWNFYAIAWHLGTTPPPVPDFSGSTSCGAATSVLNGVDSTIQINLTNAACNNSAFSSNVKLVSGPGDYQFPTATFFTCKDIGRITSADNTACNQDPGKMNKGYATSYRLVAFEYNNLGAGSAATAPIKIAQSACFRADFTGLTGGVDSSDSTPLYNLRIPTTFGNGFLISAEVFYSGGAGKIGGAIAPTGCEPGVVPDIVPISNNPRSKIFMTSTSPSMPDTYNIFIQSNGNDVCRGPRLGASNLAAGFGTVGSPFAICTKDQLSLIAANFSNLKESSFDLLTDVDYAMATIAPIGETLGSPGNTPTAYYGKVSATFNPVFDGRNHKISNFIIEGNPSGGNTPNNRVGFFRAVRDATIQNLTFNNAVVMSKEGSDVGVLAGTVLDSTGMTTIKNIKVHGHAEAKNNVGGVAGSLSGTQITASGIHVKGDYSGTTYIGGLFGWMSVSGGIGSSFSKMSFSGNVNGNQGSGGSLTPSWTGGIFGLASATGTPSTLSEIIVNSDRIEGTSTVGGFIGESNNVNITDSYVVANLKTSSNTDGSITFSNLGGAIGKANYGVLTRVFSVNGVKSYNGSPLDTTYGGLVGNKTNMPGCLASFYTGAHNPGGPAAACGFLLTNPYGKINYSGFSMAEKVGPWDAAINPTFNPSCLSPSEYGKYYEVTSIGSTAYGEALPGDILLCESSGGNHLVTLLNKDSVLSSLFPWSMPDDGYDIPRLAYEALIENEVPYLKRDCHGHYTTQVGSGTLADPKWICNYSQFTAMALAPTYYYKLKKNVFSTVPFHTPLAAGDYKLDGDGHGLYNFSIQLPSVASAGISNYGIFSELGSNSNISNLNLFSAELIGLPVATVSTSELNAGILAGSNLGFVNNVSANFSKASLDATAVFGSSISFAGLVGNNAGLISKGEANISTSIIDGNYAAGSYLYAANVVAKNSGTIEALQSNSDMIRNFTCNTSGTLFHISAQENIGSFAALNTGTIKEIKTDSSFRLESKPGSPYNTCPMMADYGSRISPFIAINQTTVKDFDARLRINFPVGAVPAPELFAINTGIVSRGFLELDSSDGNKPFNQQHTLVANWDPTLNSGLDATSSDSAVAPQATCSLADSGKYYTVSGSAASTNLGEGVGGGDVVMCNGAFNVLIYAGDVAGIMSHPMTDVFYIVRQPGAGPTLAPGRFYDDKLEFTASGGVFSIDDITSGSPSALTLSSAWAVGTDFFNPGANIWMLDPNAGASERPKLIRTDGGLDKIGSPF